MSNIVVTAPIAFGISKGTLIIRASDINNPGYLGNIILGQPGIISFPIAYNILASNDFTVSTPFSFLDFLNLRFENAAVPLISQGLGNIAASENFTFPIGANGNYVNNLGNAGDSLLLTFTLSVGIANGGTITVNVFYFNYTI